jgi:quercetin dioxygenase-like cupin family protein
MHHVGTFTESSLAANPTYIGHSQGYTEAALVDHASGSVHTGLSIAQLAGGGNLSPHVHSYEEGFYILSGQALVAINGRTYRLVSGDYGCIKVGTPHAWHNAGPAPARWLQHAAPQPKPHGMERDTFFLKTGGGVADDAAPLDLDDPGGNLLSHFDESQIPPGDEGRMVAGGLKGVFLKWLIDEQFGAIHHRLLFIEYLPGVGIGPHDHTYEEAYFILSGEVEAILDGRRYLARPGNVLWTGTGCVHAFKNISSQPVRWLETFSPQPPRENVFRFMAEWEQKAREMEG